MAKVLFINPTVREEEEPKHIPMGMAQLAAIAIKAGHDVQIFDQNAWRQDDEVVRDIISSDNWDLIGIGGITTAYASIKKLVKMSKACSPKSLISLGGGVLTSIPKEVMSWLPEIDFGFVGESYQTIVDVLDALDTKNYDLKNVDGLILRGENDKIIFTKQRTLLHDLDLLPYPAYELFPVNEVYFKNSAMMYSEEGMLATRRMDINGSLGCSLVCKFCYHLGITGDMKYEKNKSGEVENVSFDKEGNYTRNIRFHSPDYIINQAVYLKKKYNVNFIYFLDENFMTMDVFSKRTWLRDICKGWKEAGLVPKKKKDGTWDGVYWSGTSHATLCNPEVLGMMAKHGCSHLVYGYEHFDDRILKTIGKGSNRKTNLRSFFWTLKAGIRPIPNQIIGFPNEDFDSLRMQMKAWDDLGIVTKPHFATAYPGSLWFTEYRDEILNQYKGRGKQLGLKDDLEAYIYDLGDASRVSGVISKNFNAVELVGLREMMLHRQYDKIDQYEKEWRMRHNIKDGEPSTLIKDKISKFKKIQVA